MYYYYQNVKLLLIDLFKISSKNLQNTLTFELFSSNKYQCIRILGDKPIQRNA